MRTGVSVNISMPRTDLRFVRQMAKRMGGSVTESTDDRLFDSETGKYLNEETMQAIRDMEAGKVKRCKNLDELIAAFQN